MSAFLFRLGRSCARHPFRVLGLWLVAAVAVVTLQGAAGGHYENSIRVPGVESQRAADTLRDRFPAQSGKTARIVFHATDARLDDTDPETASSSPPAMTLPASPIRSSRSPRR